MNYFSRYNIDWPLMSFAQEIGKRFMAPNLFVYDNMHADPAQDIIMLKKFLDEDPANKILSLNLFDPPNDNFLNEIKDRVIKVDSYKFCLWLPALEKFFVKYTVDQVLPGTFKYKFLCYQRVPSIYRERAYELLKDKKGIVTLGTIENLEVNNNIPYGLGFMQPKSDLKVCNDTMSLGNLDIWKSCFLTIVSETFQQEHENAFIGEKTFKPIIGMRPFLCYGHPKISRFLESRGFVTFDEDFGYKPNSDIFNCVNQIVDIVDAINYKDVYSNKLWKKLYPKVEHNKNWFETAVKKEYERLEELVK